MKTYPEGRFWKDHSRTLTDPPKRIGESSTNGLLQKPPSSRLHNERGLGWKVYNYRNILRECARRDFLRPKKNKKHFRRFNALSLPANFFRSDVLRLTANFFSFRRVTLTRKFLADALRLTANFFSFRHVTLTSFLSYALLLPENFWPTRYA